MSPIKLEGKAFRKAAVCAAEMLGRAISSDQFKALSPVSSGIAAKALCGVFAGIDEWGPTCTDKSYSGFPEVLLLPAAVACEVADCPELEPIFGIVFPCQYEDVGDRFRRPDTVALRIQFENLTWNGSRQWSPPEPTPWEQAQRARYMRNTEQGAGERVAAQVAPEVK